MTVLLRFGVFWYGTEPAIFLMDVNLIKKVQITDHDHFTDLGQSTYLAVHSELSQGVNLF